MADASRRLVVLRHAKSAWPKGVPDAQRPLNERGRRDAPAAGGWLRRHVEYINAVLCSPAVRTRQTWELLSAMLDDAPEPVFDARLYGAAAKKLLTVVRELPDDAGCAMLIGHNPGMADIVTLMTGESPKMRTSAIAVLRLVGGWEAASPGGAALVAHATPRG
jgi:phosphohistidine phosphatase